MSSRCESSFGSLCQRPAASALPTLCLQTRSYRQQTVVVSGGIRTAGKRKGGSSTCSSHTPWPLDRDVVRAQTQTDEGLGERLQGMDGIDLIVVPVASATEVNVIADAMSRSARFYNDIAPALTRSASARRCASTSRCASLPSMRCSRP